MSAAAQAAASQASAAPSWYRQEPWLVALVAAEQTVKRLDGGPTSISSMPSPVYQCKKAFLHQPTLHQQGTAEQCPARVQLVGMCAHTAGSTPGNAGDELAIEQALVSQAWFPHAPAPPPEHATGCWEASSGQLKGANPCLDEPSQGPQAVTRGAACLRNMAVNCSDTRLNISCTAVELPMKVALILSPTGGMSQMLPATHTVSPGMPGAA